MENKFSTGDAIELNDRLIGYYGAEINLVNGMSGCDFDIDTARKLAFIINEIINGKDRSEFSYFAKE